MAPSSSHSPVEIGRGAQYKVLDIGSNRVRKIPLTPAESQAVVCSWYEPGPAPLAELERDYLGETLRTCASIQALLIAHPALGASLGNPEFETKGVYTQDKVSTLEQVLPTFGPAHSQQILHDYATLITHHWGYGLSESVFNFSVNNGVDRHGQIILLDFGEVTLNQAKAEQALAEKRWQQAISYKRDLAPTLQPYYLQLMGQALTPETLRRAWGAAL